jgi:hypothetical protein
MPGRAPVPPSIGVETNQQTRPEVHTHLCRDSEPKTRNLLESGGTDGHPKHPEEPLETLIAPVTHLGPLP